MPRTRTLTKVHMYCNTEACSVYQWIEGLSDPPTVCPNGADHELNQDQTYAVDEVSDNVLKVSNLPLTPFDRVLTSEETVILEIKPGNGISKLRDIATTEGAAVVSNGIGEPEYQLSATGPNCIAQLRTAERGRYLAGTAAEVGIGGHLMAPLGPGQSLKYGLFDGDNGFYFEILYWEFFVVILKDGVEHRIPRAEFNVDKMDGEGVSKVFLNPFKGYIWLIRFSWYGYGIVEFAVASEDVFNEQHIVPIHRYYTQYRASISTYNLPITVRLDSGTDVAEDAVCGAYVTGRKYAVLGKFTPTNRSGSVYSIFQDAAAPAGWTSVFSLRRKEGLLSAPVTLDSLECYTDAATAVVAIYAASDVSGATWTVPPDATETETALEYSESPVDVASAVLIWKGFARGSATIDSAIDFYLTEADAITVCVKDLAAAGEVSIGLRWSEEW
jgi:hypothetical protein